MIALRLLLFSVAALAVVPVAMLDGVQVFTERLRHYWSRLWDGV